MSVDAHVRVRIQDTRLYVLRTNEVRKLFFVNWFRVHGRSFPWRHPDTTPFQLLVTEMLLRQTRAEGVAKLWQSFVSTYPTSRAIVSASNEELASRLIILGFGKLKVRSLKAASAFLIEHHTGHVPSTSGELIRIPHVGKYTANAILCFAFKQRVAIVDNNVLRFVSRYFGFYSGSDIRRAPKVWELVEKLLPRDARKAPEHNYGFLDFTAQICKPIGPRCDRCSIKTDCHYYAILTKSSG